MEFFVVALGGAIGSAMRYGFSVCINYLMLPYQGLKPNTLILALPWATLGVNIIGSFFIGLISHWGVSALPASLRLFFTVGLCGGLTTFSAFILEVHTFLQARQFLFATIYLFCALFLPLLAFWFGITLVKPYFTKE